MFKIKISDSYCEWEYPLEISDEYSINDVYTALCKAMKARKHQGKRISSLANALKKIEGAAIG